MPKQTVIERMRAAEAWLSKMPGHSAEPFSWLRILIFDAMQEMQSESGALWLQSVLGRNEHVRIFAEGHIGARELDLLIELLTLHRSWHRQDEASTLATSQSADAVARSAEDSTERPRA